MIERGERESVIDWISGISREEGRDRERGGGGGERAQGEKDTHRLETNHCGVLINLHLIINHESFMVELIFVLPVYWISLFSKITSHEKFIHVNFTETIPVPKES